MLLILMEMGRSSEFLDPLVLELEQKYDSLYGDQEMICLENIDIMRKALSKKLKTLNQGEQAVTS